MICKCIQCQLDGNMGLARLPADLVPRLRKECSALSDAPEGFLGTVDGWRVYAVDGDWVKVEFDPDFCEGSNFAHSPDFIPPDTIWLDDRMESHDRPFIALHEAVEAWCMKNLGLAYDPAHNIANAAEMAWRRQAGQGRPEVARFAAMFDRQWETIFYAKKKPAAGQTSMFREEEHPRDETGEFVEKGEPTGSKATTRQAKPDLPAQPPSLVGQQGLFGADEHPIVKAVNAAVEKRLDEAKAKQNTLFHGLNDPPGQRDLWDLDKAEDRPETPQSGMPEVVPIAVNKGELQSVPMTATHARKIKGIAVDVLTRAGITSVYASDSAKPVVLANDTPSNRKIFQSLFPGEYARGGGSLALTFKGKTLDRLELLWKAPETSRLASAFDAGVERLRFVQRFNAGFERMRYSGGFDAEKHPRGGNSENTGEFSESTSEEKCKGGGSDPNDNLKEPTHKDIPSLLRDTLRKQRPPRGQRRMWVRYAKVERSEAESLEAETGIDATGCSHTVDDSALVHAWRLHGPQGSQLHAGMSPLNEQDVWIIPAVVSRPDRIFGGGVTAQGLQTVRYLKRINGHVLYVEEQRTRSKELAMKTFKKFDHEPTEEEMASHETK